MKTIQAQEERTLRRVARLYGIATTYRDGLNRTRRVPVGTLRHCLRVMGVPVDTVEEMRSAARMEQERAWTHVVDDVLVIHQDGDEPGWCLNVPLGDAPLSRLRIRGTIENERGHTRDFHFDGTVLSPLGSKTIRQQRFSRFFCPWPSDLTMGYYTLSVKAGLPAQMVEGKAMVIVAPLRCFQSTSERTWGITAQLYGLQAHQNWGIGDMGDAQRLIKWAGRTLGAAMVGLNPLHALPEGLISPYSPSSRLFHNPLYLDLEAIPEFRSTPSIQRIVRQKDFQETLRKARSAKLVRYETVQKLKWAILERLYRAFCRQHMKQDTKRAQAFRRYIRQEGWLLHRFALFQVLQEYFKEHRFQAWPTEFQHPKTREVEQFAERHRDRVEFFQYVEWQCERQLQRLDRTAVQSGMVYGIYNDLAIGIHPDGADAWMFQEQLAKGVTLGAPADSFNPHGQNWGLLPPAPQALRAGGYRFFRETLRAVMRHGGLLRLDHILGLFRLYWVPDGEACEDGAYIHYPVDELLAVLAVESHRHQVTVIGEDLGTVTSAIRRRLQQAGVLSYRLLLFEKSAGLGYSRPSSFPPQALAAFTTHDLPTFRGFWTGRDLEVNAQLGMYATASRLEAAKSIRARERQALCRALAKEGVLSREVVKGVECTSISLDELCQAVYAYLARTPSWIVAIPLEDLFGEIEAPNVPGAPEGAYPVWQRKIDFMTNHQAPAVRALAARIDQERKRGEGTYAES